MEQNTVLEQVNNTLMDKDYIFDHQLKLHSFDSFARAVLYEVLETAKKQVTDSPQEKISFNLEVRVEKWGTKPCNKVKIGANWIEIPG